VPGGHAIIDAPIVDPSPGRVFVFTSDGGSANSVVVQAATKVLSSIKADAGKNDLHDILAGGAFDSACFANVSTGYLYTWGHQAASGNHASCDSRLIYDVLAVLGI
jgi:hypothetical protein